MFVQISEIFPSGKNNYLDIEFIPTFTITSTENSTKKAIRRNIGIKETMNQSERTVGPEILTESGSESGSGSGSGSGSFLLTPLEAVQMMAKSASEKSPGSMSGICLAAEVAAIRTSTPDGFAAVEALALMAISNKVKNETSLWLCYNLCMEFDSVRHFIWDAFFIQIQFILVWFSFIYFIDFNFFY